MAALAYFIESNWVETEGSPKGLSLLKSESNPRISLNIMMIEKDVSLPDFLVFKGDLSVSTKSHFPLNNVPLPIMSFAMFEVLQKVSPFKCHKIPVHLVDQHSGKKTTDRYLTFKLKEYTEAMDLEASVYEKDKLYGKEVGLINKLCFNNQISLPSVFRIRQTPFIYMSSSGKEALDNKGIMGIKYTAIHGGE